MGCAPTQPTANRLRAGRDRGKWPPRSGLRTWCQRDWLKIGAAGHQQARRDIDLTSTHARAARAGRNSWGKGRPGSRRLRGARAEAGSRGRESGELAVGAATGEARSSRRLDCAPLTPPWGERAHCDTHSGGFWTGASMRQAGALCGIAESRKPNAYPSSLPLPRPIPLCSCFGKPTTCPPSPLAAYADFRVYEPRPLLVSASPRRFFLLRVPSAGPAIGPS